MCDTVRGGLQSQPQHHNIIWNLSKPCTVHTLFFLKDSPPLAQVLQLKRAAEVECLVYCLSASISAPRWCSVDRLRRQKKAPHGDVKSVLWCGVSRHRVQFFQDSNLHFKIAICKLWNLERIWKVPLRSYELLLRRTRKTPSHIILFHHTL
jgi:hypothetical protein